jgi:nanoRNase/pAp phosphatase (c-di-AMP/oligoRNAs hydrolase)
MVLDPIEQFKSLLNKSRDILILIPENPSGDAIGSAWALYFYLKKVGANATINFSNPNQNNLDKFSFLPTPEKISHDFSGARDFVLSFNTTYNKIIDFRTERTEDKFNVYLTPEKGSLDPRDFSFVLAKFKFDLMIVIDSPDLPSLGNIYEKNPDLFFEVPIVNIDHRSNNENFGQLNFIDILASSCSEVVSTLLELVEPTFVDKNIADCLLTGIISSTDSFQGKNTTPKSLQVAAKLMDQGANQQEIVRWLYKTQSLHILKLWGRAMAKLKWDEQTKFISSTLSVEDFVQSRAKQTDVEQIITKLQENYVDGSIFAILYNDTPTSVVAKIKANRPEYLAKIESLATRKNSQSGIIEISFPLENLIEAESVLREKITHLFI